MARRLGQVVTAVIPVERIEQRIYVIRDQKVLLSHDLAGLYGVSVKVLNQAVKRNLERFPSDFMFQLTLSETRNLRSQILTIDKGGHFRYRPYAFTEQGVAMLPAVLRSGTAVAVSVQIMRAFVRLRQLLASSETFRRKLAAMERKLEDHDEKFGAVFEAIRQLMDADEEEAGKPRIGYESEGEG